MASCIPESTAGMVDTLTLELGRSREIVVASGVSAGVF
tara:strand:- start:1949 stop:2062 length:114 start_codon:yes stop_codon:yes gene_type:complete